MPNHTCTTGSRSYDTLDPAFIAHFEYRQLCPTLFCIDCYIYPPTLQQLQQAIW